MGVAVGAAASVLNIWRVKPPEVDQVIAGMKIVSFVTPEMASQNDARCGISCYHHYKVIDAMCVSNNIPDIKNRPTIITK